MRKVAIYARVSTEHEAQLAALENQIQYYDENRNSIGMLNTMVITSPPPHAVTHLMAPSVIASTCEGSVTLTPELTKYTIIRTNTWIRSMTAKIATSFARYLEN